MYPEYLNIEQNGNLSEYQSYSFSWLHKWMTCWIYILHGIWYEQGFTYILDIDTEDRYQIYKPGIKWNY